MQMELYELQTTDGHSIANPPLAETLWAVWDRWLPNTWRGYEGIREYNEDPIPQPVLQKLQELESAHVFRVCELRTRSWGPRERAIVGSRGDKRISSCAICATS